MVADITPVSPVTPRRSSSICNPLPRLGENSPVPKNPEPTRPTVGHVLLQEVVGKDDLSVDTTIAVGIYTGNT